MPTDGTLNMSTAARQKNSFSVVLKKFEINKGKGVYFTTIL